MQNGTGGNTAQAGKNAAACPWQKLPYKSQEKNHAGEMGGGRHTYTTAMGPVSRLCLGKRETSNYGVAVLLPKKQTKGEIGYDN